MLNNSNTIEGSCSDCTYAPLLQEAIGEQIAVAAESERKARMMRAFSMVSVPDHVIADTEAFIAENGCDNAICAVALSLINKVAQG